MSDTPALKDNSRNLFLITSALLLAALTLTIAAEYFHISVGPVLGILIILNVAAQPVALVFSIQELFKAKTSKRKFLLWFYCMGIVVFITLFVYVLMLPVT